MGKQGVRLVNSQEIDEYMLNYMKEHNITQHEFAKALDIRNQSRISDIKNKGYSHFSVEEICNFAIVYGQSLDEMANINDKSEVHYKREKTFRDILSRLIYIDNEARVSSAFDFWIDDNDDNLSIKISFNNRGVQDIIRQWQVAKSIRVNDKNGEHIADIVKEALLKESSEYPKSANYQSPIERCDTAYMKITNFLKDIRRWIYEDKTSEQNYAIMEHCPDPYSEQFCPIDKEVIPISKSDFDLFKRTDPYKWLCEKEIKEIEACAADDRFSFFPDFSYLPIDEE